MAVTANLWIFSSAGLKTKRAMPLMRFYAIWRENPLVYNLSIHEGNAWFISAAFPHKNVCGEKPSVIMRQLTDAECRLVL